jgi:hypothetical protein
MSTLFKALFVLVFGLISVKSKAQQELHFNVSNVIFYEINGDFELGIKDYLSVSAFGSYVFGLPVKDEYDPYKKYSYLGAELRLYPGEKPNMSGFFLGVYGKYSFGDVYTTLYTNTGNNTVQQQVWAFNKTSIGITMGSKWLVKDHFSIGFLLGAGRFVSINYAEPGTVEKAEFFGLDQNLYDFRAGLMVGWRF